MRDRERAVLYARISLDDKTGEQVGVTRQLKDMRQLAEGRAEVVAEITENDISAVRKGLHRPRLRADLASGDSEASRPITSSPGSQRARSMRSRATAEVINTFGKHNVDIIAVKVSVVRFARRTGAVRWPTW